MSFHHAYNFVPTPDRSSAPFADQVPVGHHMLADRRFHGHLDVTMTVMTPLIVGEVRNTTPAGHTNLHVRSRTGQPNGAVNGGDVEIPATSVKGMLRSAFEAVTNSRFGVFAEHNRPAPFRSAPHEALTLVPVRITRDGDVWSAEPMLGTNSDPPAGLPIPLYAAALPDPGPDNSSVVFTAGGQARLQALPHGAHVNVTLRHVRHTGQASYTYTLVTHVDGHACVADVSGVRHHFEDDEPIDIDGYVCRTNGHPGVPIIHGKHDERLFFNLYEQDLLPVRAEVVRNYADVVASYLEQSEGPQHAAHPSRVVRAAAEDHVLELRDGDLVYATIEEGVIVRLQPTMIGRRLYDRSPAELVGDQVRPARTLAEFSAADRVFGNVVVDKSSKDTRAHTESAYAGQLTVGVVEPVEVTLRRDIRRLAELSSPKPAAARFYVARDRSGTPLPRDTTLFKSALYTDGQGLRGRKVYPHHRDAERGGDMPPSASRPGVPANERNASAHSWVDRGSTFRFRIDYVNLSGFELGALIWLLTPGELAAPGAAREGYHRLGRGKPLGLGSVRLTWARDTSRIASTPVVTDAYRAMAGVRGTVGSPIPDGVMSQAFVKAVADAYRTDFGQVPFIEAFRRAASGYDDDVPVSYPTGPNPGQVGPTVSWFQRNEKITNGHAGPRLNRGVSLPGLDGSPAPLDEFPN